MSTETCFDLPQLCIGDILEHGLATDALHLPMNLYPKVGCVNVSGGVRIPMHDIDPHAGMSHDLQSLSYFRVCMEVML
jgi:hypothetical protein